MIDIHNHILPGVDDGSKSQDISRVLLIDAINEGISDICITPHYSRIDNFVLHKKELLNRFNEFKQANSDLNINLYLGNELLINKDLDILLKNDELCSLNGSRYVLVEFPFDRYKSEYDEYLLNITYLGYRIIIAHPERYDYVLDKPEKYIDRWIDAGYYLQSNQSSFFYQKRKRFLFDLIESQKLHFIASDAHSEHRPLTLIDGYELVRRKFNEEVADILFVKNPENVIKDRDIINLPKTKKRLF